MCKLDLKDIVKPNFTTDSTVIKNTLPKEVGNDYIESTKIQDDLFLLKTGFRFNQPTQMEAIQKEKKFVITISLKGLTSYNNYDHQKVEFKEGFTTISLFNNTQGFREYGQQEVQQIRIILGESFLKRNLNKSIFEKYFHTKKTLNLINFSPTIFSSQLIINDILHCNLIGELATIYKQAKVLELLSLELNKLEQDPKRIFLDSYDKDAIYKAKEILIENMENPPTLTQLAKQVHLNEFKLKKGFKQVFKTSPYKLLTQYKMNHAKELLETSDYNITEIANLVGYKFSSNFTKVFFKEFGINPKELMKSRKYYY